MTTGANLSLFANDVWRALVLVWSADLAIPNRRDGTIPRARLLAFDLFNTDDVLSERESPSVSPCRILSLLLSTDRWGAINAFDENKKREAK